MVIITRITLLNVKLKPKILVLLLFVNYYLLFYIDLQVLIILLFL